MPRILDVLLGRTKPAQANLDALFGLVGAVITMQVRESLVPSGEAGVCYKPVAGRSFADTAAEAAQLLNLPAGGDEPGGASSQGTESFRQPSESSQATLPGAIRQENDQYGYHWVVQTCDDFQNLVNQVHVVNSTLQDNGYGPQLLCSVFAFRPGVAGPPGESDPALSEAATSPPPLAYLVYLYKRGSFYPFVPLPGKEEKRDHESELRLSVVLTDDLKIELDKERWMPLWGLPVH